MITITRQHLRALYTPAKRDDWPYEPFRSLAILAMLLIGLAGLAGLILEYLHVFA